MLFDEQTGLVLVGGSNHTDRKSRRGAATLYLMEIGHQARLKAWRVWDLYSGTVSAIKSYKDFYICATKGSVHILAYSQLTSTINIVRSFGHHAGMFINDMAVVDRAIVTVSDTDDCLAVSSLDVVCD